MKAIAFAGPVAVTVDASKWSHYESGVFNDCNQVKKGRGRREGREEREEREGVLVEFF